MIAQFKRSIPVLTLFVAGAAALGAQNAPAPNPYQGVSHPPADDVITTSTPDDDAKPAAGKPLAAQTTNPQQFQQTPPPATAAAPRRYSTAQMGDGTDDGIVHPINTTAPAPARSYGFDPDGDIVHPRAMRPGELREGTSIRVRLLDRLSTAQSQVGEPFHTRVATDVLQGGHVVIPAGSEIDGRIAQVSSGHVGGHGTMRLSPESVTLPNGTRYRLHAEVSSAPGSKTHVAGEGNINPNSRLKRDGIEYGSAVGAGAVTGAIVAGPVGALTGSLIGAGAITVHLMVNHPQATLESGTTLMFQLTDPLYLAPDSMNGN
jgi:hypothetical protein